MRHLALIAALLLTACGTTNHLFHGPTHATRGIGNPLRWYQPIDNWCRQIKQSGGSPLKRTPTSCDYITLNAGTPYSTTCCVWNVHGANQQWCITPSTHDWCEWHRPNNGNHE